MKIQNLFTMDKSLKPGIRTTAILCPACSSEVGLTDLIERKGYLVCTNCRR